MTRATWNEKYPEQEPRPPALDLSTAILGAGIFIVALIILAVGLIIGLQFPDFAQNRVIEEQCVTSTEHELFTEWVTESEWNRYNKLYYWVVTNPSGVLYNGQKPVLSQRGPYVYREYRHKTAILFSKSRVSFSNNISQIFDVTATKSQCADCSETDTITVLNTRHLQLVDRVNGMENYIYSQIPEVLNNTLWASTSKQIGFNADVLKLFGCLSSTCVSALSGNVTSFDKLRNISIGEWIQVNDSEYKAAILNKRSGTGILETEVNALYQTVLNSSLLGVSDAQLTNLQLQNICDSYVLDTICNSATGSSSNKFTSDETFFASCGLLPLMRIKNITNTPCLVRISELFLTFMCKNANPTCNFENDILESFYYSFRDFVLQTLAGVVYEALFVSGVHGMLETRPQRDIALGYRTADGMDMSGLLPRTIGNINPQSYDMSTCQGDTANGNMDVKVFRDTILDSLCAVSVDPACDSTTGHSLFSTPASSYSACVKPNPNSDVSMFEENIHDTLSFVNPVEIDMFGIRVHRFHLDTNKYNTSIMYPCLIHNATSLLQFPAIISEPNAGPCSAESLSSLDSFVDVEPFTGKVWRKVTRLQTNALLQANDVNARGVLPYNVSVNDDPFPIYWRETVIHLTEAASNHHHEKVTKLMDASCGGLVSLSIISLIVVIISVFIIIRPHRMLRRVAPVPEVAEDDVSHITNNNNNNN
ncbi:uncharacterized protein LOC110467095 [Mizuhopecten yessoensis]|uniref:Scavenger receptor class B member 1 n=1 Tax=Mizuhopecten yessoensis TaxID=6573 RepID=A0A210PMQ6_MIZYE|nr:uncharacterized protein LOC110467095 [Mizuhopecten yessoensis]OWF37757.1 Scavenger receptor class B member 1 [Mizuhopecten yessoensis]